MSRKYTNSNYLSKNPKIQQSEVHHSKFIKFSKGLLTKSTNNVVNQETKNFKNNIQDRIVLFVAQPESTKDQPCFQPLSIQHLNPGVIAHLIYKNYT